MDIFNRKRKQIEDATEGKYTLLELHRDTTSIFKCNVCGENFTHYIKNVNEKFNCPFCRRHKVVEDKVEKVLGSEYTLLTKKANLNMPRINVLHKKCNHSFKIHPKTLGKNKSTIGCIYCNSNYQKRTLNDLKQFISEKCNNEYKIMQTEEIKNNKELISLKHNCGTEFKATYNNFTREICRCPKCTKVPSKGENMIKNFLIKKNVNFKSEFSFPDCRNKRPLRFDFALFDDNNNLKCLVEFDGEQHFKKVNYYKNDDKRNEDKLQRTILNDEIKNNYCKANNIPLIRINYKEIDNIYTIMNNIINFKNFDKVA